MLTQKLSAARQILVQRAAERSGAPAGLGEAGSRGPGIRTGLLGLWDNPNGWNNPQGWQNPAVIPDAPSVARNNQLFRPAPLLNPRNG